MMPEYLLSTLMTREKNMKMKTDEELSVDSWLEYDNKSIAPEATEIGLVMLFITWAAQTQGALPANLLSGGTVLLVIAEWCTIKLTFWKPWKVLETIIAAAMINVVVDAIIIVSIVLGADILSLGLMLISTKIMLYIKGGPASEARQRYERYAVNEDHHQNKCTGLRKKSQLTEIYAQMIGSGLAFVLFSTTDVAPATAAVSVTVLTMLLSAYRLWLAIRYLG